MASTPGMLLFLLVILAGTMVTVHCQINCAMSFYNCYSAYTSSTGGSPSLKLICQATEKALTCLEKLASSCGSSIGSSLATQVAKLRKERGCGGAGSAGVSLLTTVMALLAASFLRL